MKKINYLLLMVFGFIFGLNIVNAYGTNLYVNGEELDSSGTYFDGTVIYDKENKLLTLNNAMIDNSTCEDYDFKYYTAYVCVGIASFDEELTVNLVGNNTIKAKMNGESDNLPFYYGVMTYTEEKGATYDLNIKGNGTLNFDTNGVGYVQFSQANGNLNIGEKTVENGPTINVIGSNDTEFFAGLASQDELNIYNAKINGTLNVEEGIEYFICSLGDMNIENSELLVDVDSQNIAFFVRSDQKLNIKNSKIDFGYKDSKNNIKGEASGIFAKDDIVIEDSNIKIDFVSMETEIVIGNDDNDSTLTIKDSKIDIKHNANETTQVFYNLGGMDIIDSNVIFNMIGEASEDDYIVAFTLGGESNITGGNLISNAPYAFYFGDSINLTPKRGSVYKIAGKVFGATGSAKINLLGEGYEPYVSEESFDKLTMLTDLDDFDNVDYEYRLIDWSEYKFLEGDKQELKIDNINKYEFRLSGNYHLFESLLIDGVEFVRDTDYEVSEGSTIIKFTESGIKKLNDLGNGEHKVVANYFNGNVINGTFALDEQKNPETGDKTLIIIVVGVICVIGVVGCVLLLRKKK